MHGGRHRATASPRPFIQALSAPSFRRAIRAAHPAPQNLMEGKSNQLVRLTRPVFDAVCLTAERAEGEASATTGKRCMQQIRSVIASVGIDTTSPARTIVYAAASEPHAAMRSNLQGNKEP
ncbi:hypothetical protein L1887_54979 [Cichorium endivia]|nr:hypothetical protein L1887_54979 [Cichorium endivia]